MSNSLVSVIIPYYNDGVNLIKCIELLKRQTYKSIELIIIDNCSDFANRKVYSPYKEQIVFGRKINIIRNSSNKSISIVKNIGVSNATGKYIIFLDLNEKISDNYIKSLVEIMDKKDNLVAIGAYFQTNKIKPENKKEIALEQLKYEENDHCPYMFTKESWNIVGGYIETLWAGYEDLNFLINLVKRGYTLLQMSELCYKNKSKIKEFADNKKDSLINLVRKQNTELYTEDELNFCTPVLEDTRYFILDNDNPVIEPVKKNVSDIKPDVSIIIPAFNQLKYSKLCIEAIIKNTKDVNYRLILVDNGSTDDTYKFFSIVKNAIIIHSDINLGFSGGVNLGLEMVEDEDVVILNNDAVVSPGWLSNMLNNLHKHDDIGMVVPLANNINSHSDQLISNSTDYLLNNLDDMMNTLKDKKGVMQNCIYIVGFCMVIKNAAYKAVGKFDENFGRGNGEDDDYALRIVLAGYRVHICKDTYIFHFGSMTIKVIGKDASKGGINPDTDKILDSKWDKFGIPISQFHKIFPGTVEYIKNWYTLSCTDEYKAGRKALFKNDQLVSVIIPCFNYGRYLDECVDSVLKQTYKNIEVIIVDDCSTDKETIRKVKEQEAKDNRVKIFLQQKNKGLSASRNVGFSNASGVYCFPLDADDYISPDAIELHMRDMSNGLGDYIYGNCMVVYDDSSKKPHLWNYEFSVDGLLKDSINQCASLIKKEHWEQVGGYNESLLNGREDWHFWLKMISNGYFGYRTQSKHPLFYYRRKADSMLSRMKGSYEIETNKVKHDFPRIFKMK